MAALSKPATNSSGYVSFPTPGGRKENEVPASNENRLSAAAQILKEQADKVLADTDLLLKSLNCSDETESPEVSAPAAVFQSVHGSADDEEDESFILSTVRDDEEEEDGSYLSAPVPSNGPSPATNIGNLNFGGSSPAPLPAELNDWQHEFLTTALWTFDGGQHPHIERRYGVSRYEDLANQSTAQINPSLISDDTVLQATAWNLQESLDHYKTVYDKRYELLRQVIGGIVPSLDPFMLGDYAAEWERQHDNLSTIIEGTRGKISHPSETRAHLINEREKLRQALAEMDADYQRVGDRRDEITTDYLAQGNVFDRQGKKTNDTVEIPNFFDPEEPLVFSRDSKGEWREKIKDVQKFYKSYAHILEEHQKYIGKFIARTQGLIEKLDAAIALCP